MAGRHAVRIRVQRSNPATGQAAHYQEYHLELERGSSIADALKAANRQGDGGLAYRVSCRQGVCGNCTVRANGKPVLACCTEVHGDLTLEPAFPDRVVKDLVS